MTHLSEHQRAAIAGAFSFYAALADKDRERFEAQVTDFLATKDFRSDVDEIDEHTRLLFAALACRLTMNIEGRQYGRLATISIVESLADDNGAVLDGVASGRMIATVTVTRSALQQAFREDDDGSNIVFHELAHVLEGADGICDGIPPLLLEPGLRVRWRDVLDRELARLRAAVSMKIPTAVLPYGATSDIELFAVATEAFFERPLKLRNAHPDLYELLVSFYRQRP